MRYLLAFALAGLTTSAAAAPPTAPTSPGASDQPGVLILATDDDTRPYVRLINDAVRDVVFAASDPPAMYSESLDASRFGSEQQGPFRQYLAEKYRTRRIDLVVALGEDALAFLAEGHGAPWPGARVMYLEAGGVSDELRRAMPLATGVVLDDHIPAALDVIRRILPSTRRVALIVGAAAIDEGRWGGYAAKVRHAGLEPIVIGGMSYDQMLTAVSHLPPDSVAFILAPMIDTRGRIFGPRPCDAFANAISVPSFSPGAQDLGCGVVGGLTRDWTLAGHVLAARILDLLHNPRSSGTTVHVAVAEYTTLAFDDRQLVRWKIDESRLPPGSVVEYRPHTLWNDYRRQVVTSVAVAALGAVLIGGMVFERSRRRRAELDAQRHLVVAAHLDRRAALGELATSLAHELSQPLNAILQNAGVAQMLLAAGNDRGTELNEIIDDIRKDDLRASEVINRMRALLKKHELQSSPVDPNALARDTVALVRADAVKRDVRLELQLADGVDAVQGDRVHLQQVLLNLLLNAVDAVAGMPAERRSVVVRTAQNNGLARVTVEDRGTGIRDESLQQIFEPFFTTKGEGMGMGLAIARSIIDAHSGHMAAENNPAGGATVWFSLPAIEGRRS